MTRRSRFALFTAVSALSLAVTSPAAAQEKSDAEKNKIQKCAAPYGTLAVNEPTDEVLRWLRGYQLGSPSAQPAHD